MKLMATKIMLIAVTFGHFSSTKTVIALDTACATTSVAILGCVKVNILFRGFIYFSGDMLSTLTTGLDFFSHLSCTRCMDTSSKIWQFLTELVARGHAGDIAIFLGIERRRSYFLLIVTVKKFFPQAFKSVIRKIDNNS